MGERSGINPKKKKTNLILGSELFSFGLMVGTEPHWDIETLKNNKL